MNKRNRDVLAVLLSTSILLTPSSNNKEYRCLPPEPIKIESPEELDKKNKLKLKKRTY